MIIETSNNHKLKNEMADQERKFRSARSETTKNKEKAKKTDETRRLAEKPTTDNEDEALMSETSTDEKTREQKQNSSSKSNDTRTFQQLVQDYGNDSE